MPTYAYRCASCETTFSALRSAGDRDTPAECPSCHGEAPRIPCIPAVQIAGGDVQQSFLYRAGKAMAKAKEERAAHEERFGKHQEYTQKLPEPDHEGPDDISRLGNVTTSDADAAFQQ